MNEDRNLALFCDFENIALGVRDAKYAKFDIQLVVPTSTTGRLVIPGAVPSSTRSSTSAWSWSGCC